MLFRRIHSGVVRFPANHATLCDRYATWYSFRIGEFVNANVWFSCYVQRMLRFVLTRSVLTWFVAYACNCPPTSCPPMCHQVLTTSNARLAHCLRCCAAGYNSLNGTLPSSLSSWSNVTLLSLESCSFTGAHCSSRSPTILAFSSWQGKQHLMPLKVTYAITPYATPYRGQGACSASLCSLMCAHRGCWLAAKLNSHSSIVLAWYAGSLPPAWGSQTRLGVLRAHDNILTGALSTPAGPLCRYGALSRLYLSLPVTLTASACDRGPARRLGADD